MLVNNVRTVSDTKRAFYNTHTRPVNTIYRRVVEELMVEMHLLTVNVDFRYDPIYALGVVSSFDRFMQGYQPEKDKVSIFNALCQAVGGAGPQQYRQDAAQLEKLATDKSANELIEWVTQAASRESSDELQVKLRAIATNTQFKYSRLFAIGLFTLLELADPELVKDEQQRTEALQQFCTTLDLPEAKVQKDLELYRSNLEKVAQARILMDDLLEVERKKRQQSAQNGSGARDTEDTSPTDPPASIKTLD